MKEMFCLQNLFIFFDNILIYSPNLPTHKANLDTVFQLLQQQKLYVNKKKYEFEKAQLAYLGQVV